jgi:hypothetical protein
VNVSNSQFTDCVADGLGVVSNVVDGAGAPVKKLGFSVENSSLSANQISNLRVANATPISQLDGKIEQTDLSRSAGTNVILENLDTAGGTHAALDLGGGSLGSTGHNCIYGAAQTDATTLNYNLVAKRDWWGNPTGPAPGRTLATGGTIAVDPVLTGDTCGPISSLGPTSSPVSSPAGQSTRNCIDRRGFSFRLHHPRGERVVRAVVYVDGKIAQRVRGRNLRRLTLRQLPEGNFIVGIRTTTNTGTIATSWRRYRGCAKTRPHNHTVRGHRLRAR